MEYEPSRGDRAPFPRRWTTEARHPKYREADFAKPWAKFFRPRTLPVQPHVVESLVAGMAPSEFGHGIDEVASRLLRPGEADLETGWTRLDDGVVFVCVHTKMPRVTAEMWDWWFGWHGCDSSRYKLWHPDAHRFSAMAENRSADRSLDDRQRYVGNVSFVDEYIGGTLHQIAIRFVDPGRMGFPDRPGWTHVCARVSLATAPIGIGWLVHQVRPTEDGSEMRSRFFLNDAAVLPLPAQALPEGLGSRAVGTPIGRSIAQGLAPTLVGRMISPTLGTDMQHHCAAEMNHLASFLPELFAAMRGTP